MTALRQRFAANRAAVQASRLFASVPQSGRLIEGVVWDAWRRRLFVTSVVGRELIYGDGQTWRAVPGLDAGSLAGIAIDTPRRRLWVASRSDERSADHQTAFRGLIGIDLDTLRPVRAHSGGRRGRAGRYRGRRRRDGLCQSTRMAGTIWRLGLGDGGMTVLVPPGRIRSPQGLVPSDDRRRLYVADYAYGIAIVDTRDGSVRRLESASQTMLDGIDGMAAYRGGLSRSRTAPARAESSISPWIAAASGSSGPRSSKAVIRNGASRPSASSWAAPSSMSPTPRGSLRTGRRDHRRRADPADRDPRCRACRADRAFQALALGVAGAGRLA